jgi:hypothetical protein
VLLLRDGALAYAMHAQTTTLRECASILDDLALPNPTPFLESIAHQREETESLLRKCGVDAEVAAALALA